MKSKPSSVNAGEGELDELNVTLLMDRKVKELNLNLVLQVICVTSGGLGLKILVARRQRGPTHNYKAII
jgi:hypothetical protein